VYTPASMIGLKTEPSLAGCQTWADLLEEESVTQVEQGTQARVRLAMSFVYLNPPRLGACVLGPDRYRVSRGDLFGRPDRHLFWVGLSGDSIDEFSAEAIYMVQGNKRFDVTSRAWTRGDRSFPDIPSAAIISLDGEMDFTEPVTIFLEAAPLPSPTNTGFRTGILWDQTRPCWSFPSSRTTCL
jgi:hypothetical protein